MMLVVKKCKPVTILLIALNMYNVGLWDIQSVTLCES